LPYPNKNTQEKKFRMKTILTTVAIGSTIVLGGCNKTNEISTTATAVQVDPHEENLAVEVTVENGEMKVMINGEERSIGDLSELMNGIDFGGGEDAIGVHIRKMMGGEGDHPEGMRVHRMKVMGGEGDHSEGMPEHMMIMMGDRGEGGPHPMMEMMHRGDGPPEGMPEHMMIMMGDGGEHGEWNGQWREHNDDRDIPEEHQFMEELSMLDEISSFMTPHSMAMLGIHMIRDELEPEKRIEALERIIDGTDEGSTSRNAALIVAIETLQELDRQDEAADLMVELVLSN